MADFTAVKGFRVLTANDREQLSVVGNIWADAAAARVLSRRKADSLMFANNEKLVDAQSVAKAAAEWEKVARQNYYDLLKTLRGDTSVANPSVPLSTYTRPETKTIKGSPLKIA